MLALGAKFHSTLINVVLFFLDQQEDQGMTQTFIDEQHHELSRRVQCSRAIWIVTD